MNKYNFRTIVCPILCLIIFLMAMSFPVPVLAQTNPYVVNFETGYTHPAVKSYSSTDTVWADSIPWKMPGVYLGTMTVNDFANDNHAARFRLTNNTSGAPAYMEMLADLPEGIQKIKFYTAMYGAETGGSLLVSYSIDSGQSWTPAGDTIWVIASHDSAMKVSLEPAVDQPVRIKIENAGTTDVRIDVDDITVSSFGTGKYVLIKDKLPTGNNISIYSDSLKIYFDHRITVAQGQLSLFRAGGGFQQVSIPSAQVIVQDSAVLFTGIQLQDNSNYYVLLSDSAFKDTVNNLFSIGIKDSAFWQFQTEDTFFSPGIVPLAGISESFLACNEAQNLMGVFQAYNVLGNQAWQCTSEGHEDSFAVNISGGFGKDVSADNEDWLISTLPFDLSAQDNPVLSFWQKGIYEGNVIRQVKVSTDYSGSGNPNVDSVHWVVLNIPGMNEEPDNQWNLIDGIDLTEYKNQPFYLAFTYACARNGAYKLFYDDIRIQVPTHILFHPPKHFSVKVLGMPRDEVLHLRIDSDKPRKIQLMIYNLQGQRLWRRSLMIPEGISSPLFSLPGLASGIYLLRLTDKEDDALIRFFIP